jgi:hypothetical protein
MKQSSGFPRWRPQGKKTVFLLQPCLARKSESARYMGLHGPATDLASGQTYGTVKKNEKRYRRLGATIPSRELLRVTF